MVDEWHLGTDKITLYYGLLSLISAISNTFFFSIVARYFSLKSITTWAPFLAGILIVAIVIPEAEWWFWITAGPGCFISMWALTGSGSYLSTLVNPERQGRVLGNNLALQVGAESLAAAIGGVLAALLVPLPLITYGVILAIGGLLLLTFKGKGDFEGK